MHFAFDKRAFFGYWTGPEGRSMETAAAEAAAGQDDDPLASLEDVGRRLPALIRRVRGDLAQVDPERVRARLADAEAAQRRAEARAATAEAAAREAIEESEAAWEAAEAARRTQEEAEQHAAAADERAESAELAKSAAQRDRDERISVARAEAERQVSQVRTDADAEIARVGVGSRRAGGAGRAA
ncbi:hypothetical protein [Actinopolymorpha pittospori]|uniref:Flagellar biosynthesis GTPase FlhF n=1 Tax=Actinopolymorpha pittospori TaxID=648752 RepID=A0A927NAW4_9ACTN|nr:hypothetical protein [Actinopolymorpha pittospori]MBE1612132.1 flagellar biosynthesis GTPase FlhF [Actinopolymorpha pittospori]